MAMHRSGSVVRRLLALSGVLASVMAASAGTPAPDPMETLQEVTVTAQRQFDKRTLDRVVIPRFVTAHGKPNSFSDQVTRWTRPNIICPTTIGLHPSAANLVSQRIMTLATSVGAPVARQYPHCKPNVEVIFTDTPREQVSHFAKTYREILGWDAGTLHDRFTFSHQIRAWYSTATYTAGAGWTVDSDTPAITVDPDPLEPTFKINLQEAGSASRLTKTMRSGFTNVLVIADSKQLNKYSLGTIADYVSMLVLTRASVEGCGELPSIVDLFSAACAGRALPDAITAADSAYLKALYTADLGKNLSVEENDLHDRMSRELLAR